MRDLKILIVDDEPLAHKLLEGYIEKLDALEIVGNCYDGISTLNFLNNHDVDIILLDIQMPDITGLELIESMSKTLSTKVIMTTAYTEYAITSFDLDQVVDYLHKPIRITRFIKAIERARKQILLESEFEQKTTTQEDVIHQDFISLKDNKTTYRINLEDILYIQSWGNYLKFFLIEDEIKIIRKTIKSLEKELISSDFQRVHKSYIVNVKHVSSINSNQIIIADQKIPIGQSYIMIAKQKILGA